MSTQEVQAGGQRSRAAGSDNSGAPRGVHFKVSEKGGVSVYGLGRFPVTLYREQWIRLLDRAEEIRQFVVANEAVLKKKE